MRWRTSLLAFLTAGFAFTGCSTVEQAFGPDAPVAAAACADPTISYAFSLHEDAKQGLVNYFNSREDYLLYEAYYDAGDSRSVAQSVSKCWDRRVSHFNAMKNLEELNGNLARILLRNMPDEDPGQIVSVYREQYEPIMQR
jgi:hypothetical protein